jgi:CRP/FNR family transcriptional regulator, anaerobic regulatory protein
MESFRTNISQLIKVTEEELNSIITLCSIKEYKKDAFLLKQGHRCESYYFIESGALRVFTIENELEITSWFAFSYYFFTELESYNLRKQSVFNIQALEPTRVISVSRKNMEILYKKVTEWQTYVRLNWEYSFIKLQQVILSFQTQNADERYRSLFDYPDFALKARQKDIASMLGITPYSLSRIRRKK